MQALFDDVVAQQGGVDVVFANAGIAAVPGFRADGGQTLDTVERSDWDKVLARQPERRHVHDAAAAAVMKRQGSGRIVVTASNAGLRPEPLVCYGYAASKAAVIHMVRHAALELAPHGILVNAICPGPFYGTLIGGRRHRASDRGDEGGVGDADPARADGRPGGAEGTRRAPRLAGLELHDGRRARDRRRIARPGVVSTSRILDPMPQGDSLRPTSSS